jgi:hypothetical protein
MSQFLFNKSSRSFGAVGAWFCVLRTVHTTLLESREYIPLRMTPSDSNLLKRTTLLNNPSVMLSSSVQKTLLIFPAHMLSIRTNCAGQKRYNVRRALTACQGVTLPLLLFTCSPSLLQRVTLDTTNCALIRALFLCTVLSPTPSCSTSYLRFRARTLQTAVNALCASSCRLYFTVHEFE